MPAIDGTTELMISQIELVQRGARSAHVHIAGEPRVGEIQVCKPLPS